MSEYSVVQLLPGGLPDVKPTEQLKPIVPSPRMSPAAGMVSVHKSLEQRARRIKLLAQLEKLLLNAPELLDDTEVFVVSLQGTPDEAA